MAIKPILFNTEMVRAILDGRKTVMRRVVKYPPSPYSEDFDGELRICDEYGDWHPAIDYAPYRPADILYVRETWAAWSRTEGLVPTIHYKADGENLPGVKWRPSIHMPKEAARIFLRVTNVRVERLHTSFFEPICPIFAVQDEGINIGDTCRECIENYGEPCCVDTVDEDGSDLYGGECGELDTSRSEFTDLWDSTIKPADRDIYGWEANPWVWAIEFERISREEA